MTDTDKEYRVLFLTRQYAPIPKVCEICVKRVRESLYTKGIFSDVLQFTGEDGVSEETEYGKVYSIGAGEGITNTTVTSKLAHLFKKASVAYRWPLFFPYQMNKRFRKRIAELEKENNYDAIIGVSLPADTVIAGVGLDNFVIYELDAITNNPQNNGRIKSLYRNRLMKMERKAFDSASLIIHMECNRQFFEKGKYDSYKSKSVYSDIPNLVVFPQKEIRKETDKILLAYFGTLTRDVRNPKYLIRLLEAIKDRANMTCEFYSRGNCEDIIEDAEKKNPGVFYQKGYVTPEEVVRIQNETDFLLSIGNNLTGEDRSLPSKILEYIAIGKPIIHVYGGANDSAVKYLEKYGLACIVYPEKDLNSNTEAVLRFITENRGKRVAFDKVKEMFPENTPDYTASIIEDYIRSNSDKQ